MADETERKPLEMLKKQQEVVMPQSEGNIEDDRFLVVDVPTREPSFAPPGFKSI